jgi:tetratricopeptide (TPR) repeat protein
MKLLVLFIGVLMLATAAYSESPREQLNQMVEQLKKNPADNALREKIIKLAQEIKPAPAIPEEAERFEGRAQFAFTNAKSPADYLDAAKEYEKAIVVAPWVAGYYSDLCTIYGKAEKYAEAKKNCEFFLASSLSGQDTSDVRKRIAGLEFAIEKGSKQKNQDEEFLKKLDGARFVLSTRANFKDGTWRDWRYLYEVRGNKAYFASVLNATTVQADHRLKSVVGVMHWDKDGYFITGREFVIPRDDQDCKDMQIRCVDEIQSISEDGNKIIEHRSYPGYSMEEKIYLREK